MTRFSDFANGFCTNSTISVTKSGHCVKRESKGFLSKEKFNQRQFGVRSGSVTKPTESSGVDRKVKPQDLLLIRN